MNSLAETISTTEELVSQTINFAGDLKPFGPEKEDCKPPSTSPSGIVQHFWSQIERLRQANRDLTKARDHFREIIG